MKVGEAYEEQERIARSSQLVERLIGFIEGLKGSLTLNSVGCTCDELYDLMCTGCEIDNFLDLIRKEKEDEGEGKDTSYLEGREG